MGKKEKTKDQILQFALEEFGTLGYDLASTNKIASKANLSKGTIFKYFHSKSFLYYTLFTQELDRMITAMKQFLQNHQSQDLFQTVVDTIFWKATYAKEHAYASQLLLEAISKPPQDIQEKIMSHLNQLSELSMDLFFDQIPMDSIRSEFSKADVKRQFQIAVNGLQTTYVKPGITYEYLDQIREEAICFLKTLLQGMEKTNESH